ncbi:acyl-CoA synthetase [Variovorax sp. OV329]|uniref:acyl-CoA synthetase n=1 Tax=Variovorax sp. OV329 TaxID=1882825 RepID=UPI0008F28CA3|nr:acyl-CoA synthetase [Variovorax sp. OV329]SFN39418.1 fatty-acyl-CoA synthase [Variovorax sp. OV329]
MTAAAHDGFAAPFAAAFPIRSIEDVQRLERTPIAEALPVASTYEIFRNSARAFGDKTALTFLRTGKPEDEPIRWSYAKLLQGIHQTANLLHRLGVQPSDAVAVLLPGCLDYHLALWGGEAAAIVQPLNPLLTDEKLVSLMRTAGARVLIAYGSDEESGMWSKALRIRGDVPTLKYLLRVAPHDEATPPVDLPAGVLDFNAERAGEADDRLVSGRRIQPTDIAAYFHTGGTTGAPKLARHSHGAQVFTAWASTQLQAIGPTDLGINGYPLFHVAGVLPAALTSLSAGAETVIPTPSLMRNREVLANYWRLVQAYRATSVSAVPTVLAALCTVPLDGADISSVRFCRTGASVLSPELAARFERLFGVHVHESLGMTEMAGISTITPPGVVGPAGCVGFRLPYSQLRIVALDASGKPSQREMPRGEAGMVLFKSPNLFSGYLNPKDNEGAFTEDGWLITGDLGFIDADERLNLSGRAKDLIIRSGHNIDPKTIEDALSAHPAVQICAAVGAPDAYAGELPVAYVSLLPGVSVDEGELLDFAARGVDEAPARPKSVVILDKIPMTNVGKVYKPELRLMAAQAVVQALVAKVAGEMKLGEALAPQVRASEPEGVVVRIDATSLGGERADALHKALQAAIEPLPLKVAIRRD